MRIFISLSLLSLFLLRTLASPSPTPAPWPLQFHSILVINNSAGLQVTDLWYDWPNGRNFNIIQHQLGKKVYDLEWNNGTSYYYTLDANKECRTVHFPVGILRPNFLDDANYTGQEHKDGFLCNVWEKVDFIRYYEDAVTNRPVAWTFISSGMRANVMTFEVGKVLDDPNWQAPVYCFGKAKNKQDEDTPLLLDSTFGFHSMRQGGLPTLLSTTNSWQNLSLTIVEKMKLLISTLSLSLLSLFLPGGVASSEPTPTPWPVQFHSSLVINNSVGKLQINELWYDWPNRRNINIIHYQLKGILYDVEWDNGTSYYYTTKNCTTMHFPVGILRPNFLDGANYLGQMHKNGFLCNLWEKVDFIWYYEDVITNRPVSWTFYTGMTVQVMNFEVGKVLEEAEWQAPAYCFDEEENKAKVEEDESAFGFSSLMRDINPRLSLLVA